MKRISFILLVAASFWLTACDKDDDDNNTTTLNGRDRSFLDSAAFSNNNEINFAQLALSRSSDDSVRLYAQTMISHHTMAMQSLDSLATTYNLNLPDSIDPMHASLRNQLAAMTGHMFDSSYIASQIMDHRVAISLFQSEVSNGNSQNVRNYASRTLPQLQTHLVLADSVAAHLR